MRGALEEGGAVDPDGHGRFLTKFDPRMNAAQKRQWQRDKRRNVTNPNRSWWEEDNERRRKDQQAWNRGNPRVDPYHREYGDPWFAHKRESARDSRCIGTGWRDCGWEALNVDPFDGLQDWDDLHKREYRPGAWPDPFNFAPYGNPLPP